MTLMNLVVRERNKGGNFFIAVVIKINERERIKGKGAVIKTQAPKRLT